MIKVTVRPFALICEALGKQQKIEVELNSGATVSDLLSVLRKSYNLPDEIRVGKNVVKLFDGKELRDMAVLKNGANIKSLEGVETKLEDGAVIVLLIPGIAG
jgi:molybdopterin converting factor small subunit